MRLVLSISEKAARALRVAAAEQGHRGVSAYIETLYGFDSLPVAPVKGTLTPEEHALAWENIKRLGLVPSKQEPEVPPLTGDPEQLVVALDCGFGPGPFLIDSERAKEVRTAHDEFRHDGQTETLVRVADPIVAEEGAPGEGHE